MSEDHAMSLERSRAAMPLASVCTRCEQVPCSYLICIQLPGSVGEVRLPHARVHNELLVARPQHVLAHEAAL